MKIITFLQQIKHRNTAGKGKNVGAPDQREFQLEKLQAKCLLKSMKKARPNVAGKKVRHLEQKSYYKF